tara:strand:- start:305 stop:628 length:324 start_codon:yes stop_codon:yes gene_type:complete
VQDTASIYKVEFLNTPASSIGNGFYIYTEYFSVLNNSDTTTDVRLNKTGASSVVNSSANWFFASTEAAVISLYNQSISGTSSGTGTYNDQRYLIGASNLSNYTIVVR